ncbi:hypothetical protein J8273_4796 [Carpediemonas membranifera]|uniref:Uncharacterized protein n=1 Tax=Carpediemonas membranifera TaxID=201153 RepID=A0A8J6B670_9EUKA|nr:hypothetical protein J8273_4796 [Carpediemonas membranifera]|eukprot:KAG9393677.1 hypothetical protein J8273_4796 [Carpediemonas membranifera]
MSETALLKELQGCIGCLFTYAGITITSAVMFKKLSLDGDLPQARDSSALIRCAQLGTSVLDAKQASERFALDDLLRITHLMNHDSITRHLFHFAADSYMITTVTLDAMYGISLEDSTAPTNIAVAEFEDDILVILFPVSTPIFLASGLISSVIESIRLSITGAT